MREPLSSALLDITEKSAFLADHKAIRLITMIAYKHEASEMQQMDPEQIDRAIMQLRFKDVSVRQLSRVTNISQGHVENVLIRIERLV